ncbi:hypothetical protein ABZ621_04280 [Streptomyces sp. NPDC007863]|uniref:hypothetical protein n=1 Tax=Streptomyces sp. NPDC007863 TaxID=3154894 RepID=UPI0034018A13
MSSAVPYQADDLPATSPVTFLFRPRDGGGVEATGECPVCRCVTTRAWDAVQYVAKGRRIGKKAGLFPDGEPEFAMCLCATWHVDRPAEVREGCGASFWIAPPPPGSSL